ncbi:MAG TPA: glycosyltransferase family 39 protein [Terriglobales bacterium]|nr:glycosyltransferase family 39 protein [Terriglobales bacterium]
MDATALPTATEPVAEKSAHWLIRLCIPTLLLAAFAAQSLWFIKTQSLTYDEPGHIIAGLEAWHQGRFQMWTDHPPLGRFWLTLPIARSQVEITQQPLARGYRVTAIQPGAEWIARHTRPMNTLLGLALGLTLWFATRRIFSEGAANVALALFAFTPSLIANFSVATTDGIGALFVFLTAWQLVRWRQNPSRLQTALMGLVLGGLMLSKLYTPPELLLALVLMLFIHSGRYGDVSPWRPVLAALVVALLIWWAGYLFHVSHVKVGNGQVVASFPKRETKTWATKSKLKLDLYVPAGEYFEGLREVALSSHRGREAWFLGSVYRAGAPKLYYPVVIGLKWPTILLLLFALSFLFGLGRSVRASNDLFIFWTFALVFFVFAFQSHFGIGERHILPLYPFALMIAGGIWEHARQHRAAMAALILLVCLNAADCLRYAPDYLAYFNIFVKPETSWRLLTDSNLDWGQGLIALREYEQQHPAEDLRLAYFGSVDPKLYGIKAKPLAPFEQVRGKVVIGGSCLSGQVFDDAESYRWLWAYRPQRAIDHSMWLFNTAENRPQR